MCPIQEAQMQAEIAYACAVFMVLVALFAGCTLLCSRTVSEAWQRERGVLGRFESLVSQDLRNVPGAHPCPAPASATGCFAPDSPLYRRSSTPHAMSPRGWRDSTSGTDRQTDVSHPLSSQSSSMAWRAAEDIDFRINAGQASVEVLAAAVLASRHSTPAHGSLSPRGLASHGSSHLEPLYRSSSCSLDMFAASLAAVNSGAMHNSPRMPRRMTMTGLPSTSSF